MSGFEPLTIRYKVVSLVVVNCIDGSRRIPVEALDAYIADLLAQEGTADAEAS